MTHTGTPKPFRTRSLKVRLAQREAVIARMTMALEKIELEAYQARHADTASWIDSLETIRNTAQDALSTAMKETP